MTAAADLTMPPPIAGEPDRRLAHRVDGSGHWLVFDAERTIVGCFCGFRADVESDAGYGDTVLDHFEAVVRREAGE